MNRKRLQCHSFHSVKGGVGKSTLSTFLAIVMARDMPTTLVDMDLTGTSLADALPLCAPSWAASVNLCQAPDAGFLDRARSRRAMTERDLHEADALASRTAARHALHTPPFLNDFLLYQTPDWQTEADVHPAAVSWRMAGGPEALRVIPSSALPGDLARIMPVIFDEDHAAFLEARLEYLLDGMLAHDERPEQAVVFDTPPSIPGLSRAVLSLALRLGKHDKEPLAEDHGYIPAHLRQADIKWTINLVVTSDLQDLRAANRWLQLVPVADEARFRVIINRIPQQREPERIERELRNKLLGPLASLRPGGPMPNMATPSLIDDLADDLNDRPLALLDFERVIVPDLIGLRLFDSEDAQWSDSSGRLQDIAAVLRGERSHGTSRQ